MPFDTDEAANRAFRDEAAFLLAAESAAEHFTRKVSKEWKLVGTSQDELREIAGQFARAVQIAKEYHLGAAECGQ